MSLKFPLSPDGKVEGPGGAGRRVAATIIPGLEWVAYAEEDNIALYYSRTEKCLIGTRYNEDETVLSTCHDDIIALDVHAGRHDDDHPHRICICALHRSGLIRCWQTTVGADQKPDQFTLAASWNFGLHIGTPKYLACHAEKPLLAIATLEGSVRVYDISDGKLTHNFVALTAKGDSVVKLKVHPTSLLVCAASHRGMLYVMDLYRKVICAISKAHSSAVTDIAFVDIKHPTSLSVSPLILTVSADRWVKIWDLHKVTEKLIPKIQRSLPSEEKILTIPWGQPEGEMEAVAGRHLISKKTQPEERHDLKRKRRRVDQNETTASCVKWILDSFIDLKALNTPSMRMRLPEEVNSIAVAPYSVLSTRDYAGKATWFLVAGGDSGQLKVWDILAEKEITDVVTPEAAGESNNFVIPHSAITHIHRIDMKSRRVFVSGCNGTLTEWDLERFVPVRCLKGGDEVCLTQRAVTRLLTKEGMIDMQVYGCTISGKLQRISAKIKSLERGCSWELSELKCADEVVDCDISLDGELVALLSRNGGIGVVDTNKGHHVLKVPENTCGPQLSIFFSRRKIRAPCPTTIIAGRPFLVTIGTDNFLRLWSFDSSDKDVVLRSPGYSVKGSDKQIYATAISPDSKYIVTGGADKKVRVWSCLDLSLIKSCKGHGGPITAIEFSRMHKMFATAGMDQTIRLWDLRKVECLRVVSGFSSNVTQLHFFGEYLMAGTKSGDLHVWNREGEHMGHLRQHEEAITFIKDVVVEDGMQNDSDEAMISIVSGSRDGGIAWWSDISSKNRAEEIAEEKDKRNELSSIDICLTEKNYREAMRIALKWRQSDSFEKIIARMTSDVTGVGGGKISTEGLLPVDSDESCEAILMAAIEFSKKPATLHYAEWLIHVLLRSKSYQSMQKLEGFREFCTAFAVKASAHVSRLERLREKSYLLDLILKETGDLLA